MRLRDDREVLLLLDRMGDVGRHGLDAAAGQRAGPRPGLHRRGPPARGADPDRVRRGARDADDDALLGLADAYRATGDPRAEATHRRALALQPNYWAVYNQLGFFYYRAGRYAEAIPMFREFARLRPDSVRAYNNLGAVLFYDGGNVYGRISVSRFVQDYSNTVGFGFRYNTPVGPVRFDIGRNLNPVTGFRATQFFITLGQAF